MWSGGKGSGLGIGIGPRGTKSKSIVDFETSLREACPCAVRDKKRETQLPAMWIGHYLGKEHKKN